MAKKTAMSVWYDREGDFLEVVFDRKPGYFRETSSDQVMEKVDKRGRILGFHILRVSRIRRPLNVSLPVARAAR